jgi:hypothetical protein
MIDQEQHQPGELKIATEGAGTAWQRQTRPAEEDIVWYVTASTMPESTAPPRPTTTPYAMHSPSPQRLDDPPTEVVNGVG